MPALGTRHRGDASPSRESPALLCTGPGFWLRPRYRRPIASSGLLQHGLDGSPCKKNASRASGYVPSCEIPLGGPRPRARRRCSPPRAAPADRSRKRPPRVYERQRGGLVGRPAVLLCLSRCPRSTREPPDYQLPLAGQPPLPAVVQVRVTMPSALRAMVNVSPLAAPAFAVTLQVVPVPSAALR